MSPTDNELMMQVRDGEVNKLALLYERHHEKLFNFIYRLSNRRDVSEDLMQEVFLRILKYRHTFRGDAAFTTWMFQMGRNVLVDHARKWREHPTTHDVMESSAGSSSSPAEILEHIEKNDLLTLALSRLSEDKREVLILSRFLEMKYEEISTILNHPVGTIKARVHFALKDLRDIYLSLSEEAVL